MYVLDQALVDSHLIAIPGLGTLTTRRLAGGDLQDLSGETDGALNAEVLGLGALEEFGGDYTNSHIYQPPAPAPATPSSPPLPLLLANRRKSLERTHPSREPGPCTKSR
jgi:hypothetical protein